MFQIDILELFGSYDTEDWCNGRSKFSFANKETYYKLKSTKNYFNLLAALIFLRCKLCLLGLTKQNPSLSLYILEPA